MLGFGKKKGDKAKDSKSKAAEDSDQSESSGKKKKKAKTKKRFSIKKLIVIILVLGAIGASAFVVYTLYFSKPSPEERIYKKIELAYLSLPDEMQEFTFYKLPKLYDAFLAFNSEMKLIDQEIERIQSIEEKYPDQQKIALKQKTAWQKVRSKLEKAFLKLEKPVKELYVLNLVNPNAGEQQITEKAPAFAQQADTAIKEVQEATQELKTSEPVPEGMIKGTVYKLKKKFL